MKDETRGDRLRIARKARGLSQGQAAKLIGIPLSTYSSKERAQQPGGRDYDPEEARLFARHLKVNANWLLHKDGPSPTTIGKIETPPAVTEPTVQEETNTTPVVGWFGAPTGEGALFGFDAEIIRRPCFAGKATVALEIKGRSVAEGMFAFFNFTRRPLPPNAQGLMVLGVRGESRLLLRRVHPDGKGGVRIDPFNSGETVDARIVEWASPVLAFAPR